MPPEGKPLVQFSMLLLNIFKHQKLEAAVSLIGISVASEKMSNTPTGVVVYKVITLTVHSHASNIIA